MSQLLNRVQSPSFQHLPSPPLGLPPPSGQGSPKTQTAPNFDSLVTTVPVRLSQAVQTEDIYRCVADTATHTMTHTRDPRWARPTGTEPGLQTADTSPQPPGDAHAQERLPDPDTEPQGDPETRPPGTGRDPDTHRRARPRDTQIHTPHERTETHSQTETHSATRTPDTSQARRCLTRPPPPPPAKVDIEPA